MNQLDLIIDALEKATWTSYSYDDADICKQALAAARELRDKLYVKEMEQPTPKQSGKMSITVSKVCEADALPPTTNAIYWMDMVVANLVRNGVNKHRARELAYHFYTYTTPIGEQA